MPNLAASEAGRHDMKSAPQTPGNVGAGLAEVDAALGRGDIEEARRLTLPLVEASRTLDAGLAVEAHAHLRLACCHLALSQWERARSAAREAAGRFALGTAPAEEILALSVGARACAALGLGVEAVEVASLAISIADDLAPGRWTVQAHLGLAMAFGWSRAFEQSAKAFQAAREAAARHLGIGEQLEVAVEGLWLNVFRWAGERTRQPEAAWDVGIGDVVELWKAWERQPAAASLTPGLSAGLPNSLRVACGLMSAWSGDTARAQTWLEECQPGPESCAAPSWLLAAQAWLRAELALASGNVAAAELHVSRMVDCALEVEHRPMAMRAHRLRSDIHLRQGRAELAMAELHRQLEMERMLAVRQLERRDEVARQDRDRIRNLAAESDKYRTWAYQDALTGIANLRRFNESLSEWAAACQDEGARLCVALIDVDRFKSINDTYSHMAGDEVLCSIAAEMSAQVRGTDLPARWGGDEFAILFRDSDESTALDVVRRIQAAVAARDWGTRYPGLKVDISVGVVEARPGDGKQDLVQRSDAAMYSQKKARRQRLVPADIPAGVIRRVASWLRRAERVVVLVGARVDEDGTAAAENFASWTFGQRSAFAHVRGLKLDPERFQSYWQEWRHLHRTGSSESAHLALAELSRLLPETLFVTERIDGALTIAGVREAIELYGNAYRDRCAACGRVGPASQDGVCLACGNSARTLRPDITLLGESADRSLLARAELAMKRADVVIVVDSDATTFPSAGLLEKARARSARIVMLGDGSRTQRERADVSIRAASEPIVRALIAELGSEGGSGELSDAGFEIQCYLSGQGTDSFGLTLQESLAWSSRDIERHLATLPWMFPLLTRSQVDSSAPVPTREDFDLLRQDRQVTEGMRRAFLLMLRHYGLQWRNARVERAPEWMHGFALWAVSGSYHDRFISRILGALTLCGLRDEALAFLRAVEEEVVRYRGDEARTPLGHWRLAVSA